MLKQKEKFLQEIKWLEKKKRWMICKMERLNHEEIVKAYQAKLKEIKELGDSVRPLTDKRDECSGLIKQFAGKS